MNSLCVLGIAIILGAPFNILEIPTKHDSVKPFIAFADSDTVADLFVIDGLTLTIYSSAHQGVPHTITLNEGTTALDVADITGDGQAELVAISADRIELYSLRPDDAAKASKTAFRIKNYLSDISSAPFPHVLVVNYQDSLLLALPTERGLELLALDGSLSSVFPVKFDADQVPEFKRGFSAWSVEPGTIGPAGSLELHVNQVESNIPIVPESLRHKASDVPASRTASPSHARDARHQHPNAWPWYPLKSDGSEEFRALFALGGADYSNTLIRVQRPESRDLPGASRTTFIGPKRRYPGSLVIPGSTLPDFDGDGYVDMLLWNTRAPAVSIDSIIRAVQSLSWPLTLTIHLFSEKRQLYAPRPTSHIELSVPIQWFLTPERGVPLHNLTLHDFNGDNHTDLALSPDDKTFALWLYNEGMNSEPDYIANFQEPIQGIELLADLGGAGKTSIVLRSQHALHVLSLP